MKEQKSSSELSVSLCSSSHEPDACLPGALSQTCRATSSPSEASSSDEGEEPLAGDESVAANETLQQFLQSDFAARFGWDPLFTAIDTLSIALDVRSLGLISTGDRAESERYRGFVHTMRAATQVYLLPGHPNPALAGEAERYLASGPTGTPIFAPATAVAAGEERPVLASGFIATGVSGWGDSSRISSVRALMTRIVRLLAPLSEESLEQDLERAKQRRAGQGATRHGEGYTTSEQIAELVLQSFICGFCLDALREQGFQWRLQTQVPRLFREVFAALEGGRLGELNHELRTERLERIASSVIRGAFKALDLTIPPGLLRDRRSGKTS